jgi:hypothetical protein
MLGIRRVKDNDQVDCAQKRVACLDSPPERSIRSNASSVRLAVTAFMGYAVYEPNS